MNEDEMMDEWRKARAFTGTVPMSVAADDIDRLRAEIASLRLTDAEREAMEWFAEVRKPLGSLDGGEYVAALRALRSRLVRLRPEWEGEDQELERTHGVRHTQSECTKQGDGIVLDSRNANEPVAWGVMRVGGGWVSILGNAVQAETSRQSFDKMENWVHEVVPLYSQPSTVVAKSAVAWAVVSDDGVYDSSFGDKAEAYEWRAEVMAEMGREYFVVPLYRLEGQQ